MSGNGGPPERLARLVIEVRGVHDRQAMLSRRNRIVLVVTDMLALLGIFIVLGATRASLATTIVVGFSALVLMVANYVAGVVDGKHLGVGAVFGAISEAIDRSSAREPDEPLE